MYQAAGIWLSLLLNIMVLSIPGNSSKLFARNMPGTPAISYHDTGKTVHGFIPGGTTERKSYGTGYSSLADTLPPIVYMLAPDLSVKTKVFGTGKSIAQVSFYYGELLVYSGTVIQPSPVIVTTDDIIVGFLQINKGMTITLGIPSRIQPGQIMLKAQYITKDHPLTSFNGLIATWSL